MKKSTRFTALLLAVALLVGVCCSAVSASEVTYQKYYDPLNDTGKEYRILSIGDSTSIGFGLCDFGTDADGKYTTLGEDNNGMGVYSFSSQSSPAYILSESVQESLGSAWKVQPVNLGMEGMRYQEIRSILDPSYTGDEYNQYHLEKYKEVFTDGNFGYLKEEFEKEIKTADCIVLDSITNSYGTYLCRKLVGSEDYATDETVSDVADLLYPGSGKAIEKTMKLLVEAMGLSDNELVQEIVEGLAYTYADFTVSFTETIRLIRELNSDATILVVGTYNVFDGVTAKVTTKDSDGTESSIDVDFGDVWDSFLALSDKFVTTICSQADAYTFVEIEECETMATQLANASTIDDIYGHTASALLLDVLGDKLPSLLTVEQFEKLMLPMKTVSAGVYNLHLDSVLYLYQLAMRDNYIDLTGTLELLPSAKVTIKNVVEQAAEKKYLTTEQGVSESADNVEALYNSLSPSVQSLLHAYVQLMAGRFSPGAHPSVKGLQQKAAALKKAWKTATSEEEDDSSETGMLKQILAIVTRIRSVISSVFQTNPLQKLLKIFQILR